MKAKVKTTTITRHTITLDEIGGWTGELQYEPGCSEVHYAKVGDVEIIGYLVSDPHCDSPFDSCDCIGRIVQSGSREAQDATNTDRYNEPLLDADGVWVGLNKYVVLLDKYEHTDVRFNIAGSNRDWLGGWDTSHNSHVWIPTRLDIEELDGLYEKEPEKDHLREYVNQILDTYNTWLAGDCWGVIVETRNATNGELVELDAVWGYIGSKWAEEALADTFKHTVKHFERKAEKEGVSACFA